MITLANTFPTPTPDQLITWLICLVAVCGVLGGTVMWVLRCWAHWVTIRNEGKKLPIEQPLIVKHADVFVTKEHHSAFERKMEEKLDKVIAGQAESKTAAAKREYSIKDSVYRGQVKVRDDIKKDVEEKINAIQTRYDERLSRAHHRINQGQQRLARLEQATGVPPPAEEDHHG